MDVFRIHQIWSLFTIFFVEIFPNRSHVIVVVHFPFPFFNLIGDSVMSCKLYAIVLMILMAVSTDVFAESTYIHLGAWSKHIDIGNRDNNYNETHNLIAIESNNWMAGRFKNSYDDETFFVGHRFTKQWHNLELGLTAGAMHGYRDCRLKDRPDSSKKLCPFVVPSVTYTKHRIQPSVMLLGNAVAFGFRLKF